MRAPSRRLALIAAAVIAGLLVLLLGAWALDSAVLSGQVARNVRLDGVAVGGLSDPDLRVEVARIADQYETKPVHLVTPSGTVEATLMDLGVTVDQQTTVRGALAVGRDDAFLMRPVRWLRALTSPRRAPLEIAVNPPQVAARIAALETDQVTDPVEPTLALDNDQLVAVPGVPGRSFDTHDLAAQLRAAAAAGGDDITLDIEPVTVAPATSDADTQALADRANRITANPLEVVVGDDRATVPPATLRTWLTVAPRSNDGADPTPPALTLSTATAMADIARLLDTPGDPATDLTWSVGPNDVPSFTEGRPGTACCTAESMAGILPALESGAGTVELALGPHLPAHDATWAQNLGIRTRISTFTTRYPAGQARVVNIHRIADIVRGMVIPPGETWSLNGSVGQRTTAKGFVDAPVIYNGEHDSDIGGGVSQFATTTFNAAFFGGLDFEEYQSHSLYISRYPYGREATVSWKQPDLKIKNITPYGILIWPTYTGTSLTVTLYSSPWVTGEQTGQTERPQGPCTKVITQRTRTWARDGHQEVDTVFATYRPSEGVNC
ncbi:MAG: VanW family protein [Acidimicrobiales bacterium]